MTDRQRKIIRAILEALHLLDGGQMREQLLNAEVNLRVSPTATKAEFDDALNLCDNHGWLTGIQPRLGGSKLWNISDAGSAIRLELK